MFNEASLKFFCVLTLLGLTAAAPRNFNSSSIDFTALVEPTFSETIRPFFPDDFCDDYIDTPQIFFPYPDDCSMYVMCTFGDFWIMNCTEGQLFDPIELWCYPEDEVTCLDIPNPTPPGDDLCPPPGSNEVRFLPSEFCDSYYICMNGQPVLRLCRPGQHWNAEREFCDDPEFAGCDEDFPPNSRLPECPVGRTVQLPHPHNCNWFIHCANGNRSIQQCQHLHHFDIVSNSCVFKRQAKCIKDA